MIIDSAGKMEITAGTSSKEEFNIRNKASKLSQEKEQKLGEKSGNTRSQALQSVPQCQRDLPARRPMRLPSCLPTQSLPKASAAALQERTAAGTTSAEVGTRLRPPTLEPEKESFYLPPPHASAFHAQD